MKRRSTAGSLMIGGAGRSGPYGGMCTLLATLILPLAFCEWRQRNAAHESRQLQAAALARWVAYRYTGRPSTVPSR